MIYPKTHYLRRIWRASWQRDPPQTTTRHSATFKYHLYVLYMYIHTAVITDDAHTSRASPGPVNADGGGRGSYNIRWQTRVTMMDSHRLFGRGSLTRTRVEQDQRRYPRGFVRHRVPVDCRCCGQFVLSNVPENNTATRVSLRAVATTKKKQNIIITLISHIF